MTAGKRGRPRNDSLQITAVQDGPNPGLQTVHIRVEPHAGGARYVTVIRPRTGQRKPAVWAEQRYSEKHLERGFLGPYESFRRIAEAIWERPDCRRFGKDVDAITDRMARAYYNALKKQHK